MHDVKSVKFNDGTNPNVFALVVSTNEGGTLNLITFPTSSPVEHENDIPEGTGGRTWHA